MTRKIESGEAIVLHSREGREGGKTLSLFTMQKGRMVMSLPRTVMARCGSGLTAPFSLIRYTASVEGEYALLSQYEGHLLFDMMKLPYEDMAYWFYVIELSEKLFPQGEKDDGAYDTLLKAGSMGGKRNSLPLCFMTAVKLLAQSGFDAASPEEAEENHLSPEALSLLAAIFGDKTAVDEETVRLRSHIAQYRSILELDEPVGRKLDFLTQELNRETNTIGSKCQDLDITRTVVDMKAEIEKIREQIQNLE